MLQGTANLHATGNTLNNWLQGNSGDNILDGGDGDDRLAGHDGNDTLIGGNGNDRLDGGNGADTLIGGIGADALTGGAGADVFVFGSGFGRDRIWDFNASEDKLDLTAFGIDSAAELMPYAANSGQRMLITISPGNVITIDGFSVAEIHDGMFVT